MPRPLAPSVRTHPIGTAQVCSSRPGLHLCYRAEVSAAHHFLQVLAVVLAVAGVTTVLFQRLRQPVILGYILAGFIVGPHVPVPLVADRAIVQTLSELGVMLLMFGLGLEFSLRKLAQVGPVAGGTALVQSSIMVWLGFLTGRAFGWTPLEGVVAGFIVAISSTTIVAKVFDEQRVRGQLRDLVVGVLLVQDLLAVLFMALLTALATGAGLSPLALGITLGKLGAFLALLLAVGLLTVPRAVRAVRRLGRPETLLVVSLAICFVVAWLALQAGYSVALGAFIAGSLVSESGEAHAVEGVVRPVRDLFAAIFFVSVGMLIDPVLVARHWGAVLAFIALVVAGKSLSVVLRGLLTGNSLRVTVRAALSLAQIGEFSFILAALSTSLGATRDFLYPVAVATAAATTLTTPWLIERSGAVADQLDRRLPASAQTVLSLYGSWIEQIRSSPRRRTLGAHVRRLLRAALVDMALVIAVIIGTALFYPRLAAPLQAHLGLSWESARGLALLFCVVIALPFGWGLVQNARRLGIALAMAALPPARPGRPDLAAAPRRALLVLLQLAATLLVLLPIAAITQPFLPGVPAAALLAIAIVVLGLALRRSAVDLQGHVRAGAQVIVEVLARQAGSKASVAPSGHAPGTGATSAPMAEADVLASFRALFPGLGEPRLVRLVAGSAAAGKTLSELGVRGRTGATVLAIGREGAPVTIPDAGEVLREGDLLALAGTQESVSEATLLLGGEPAAA